MMFGTTGRNLPSRFLREVPTELCDEISPFNFSAPTGYTRPDSYSKNESYSRPSTSVGTSRTPSFGTHSTQKATVGNKVRYTAGQRVEHSVFGIGVIAATTPMGGDTLLEIHFDKVGVKKLMAGYAKLNVL